MASGMIEFELVLRNGVEIEAPPGLVWDCLDRVREWKPGVASVERLRGEHGSIGEVLRLGHEAGDGIVYVIHRTLELERNAWKVQWLETEDGHTTKGYVVHSLYERASRTLLVGELLARACVPVAAMPGLSAGQASRIIVEATRAKLHADHLALKQFIERE